MNTSMPEWKFKYEENYFMGIILESMASNNVLKAISAEDDFKLNITSLRDEENRTLAGGGGLYMNMFYNK